MPVVLGLGNPGERYARTRHNVAWRLIERLVERWRALPAESEPRYRAWRAARGERDVDLVVPLTYMNRSGEALAAWSARHGTPVAELLVVADDVYLPAGFLRLRARGSSGGHRGLASIEETLGGTEYARLRIGVGAAEAAARLPEHVLAAPAPEEEADLEAGLHAAEDAVACWLERGLTAAMNEFNRKVRKEDSDT